jgi:uncharacterized protein YneF (UPF0154 family)
MTVLIVAVVSLVVGAAIGALWATNRVSQP